MESFLKIIAPSWYLWVFILIFMILKPFFPKIKGYFGEKSVSVFLSKLDPTKYKVINNIMLQVGNKTTQIDHVVVSNYGIFVIETKNYQGWIFGNDYDDYWTQSIYKSKKKFRNPIKQNFGHVQALKKVLVDFPMANYIPIVSFSYNSDLKVKSNAEVVYTLNLIKTIKKYSTETIEVLDKEMIYSKLISLNVDSKENRIEHVTAIHKTLENNQRQVANNICPKCGGNLVLRNGKYGFFQGCSNYPSCRFVVNEKK